MYCNNAGDKLVEVDEYVLVYHTKTVESVNLEFRLFGTAVTPSKSDNKGLVD